MEVDKEQHEDIPDYNTEYELHDGNQELDSPTENGENKDIHYNSQSDSEEEIHKTVPSNSDRKRGMIRLPKLNTEYVNSGEKKRVRFDEFGKFTGKNNPVFVSYLGDLFREMVGLSALCWKKVKPEMKDKLWEEITRYFEVHESGKQFVMNRLGILLRNFRRKLYADYIKPHLGDTDMLEKIPVRHRAQITEQDYWNKFVTYTQSQEFNNVSQRSIKARKMSKYDHRIGRGGYTTLRRKLIEENVISKEEIPPRSVMWCKGRESKGEFKDEDVKIMADKLMEHEKQITEGQVNVEPGIDAMNLVFGKEKGGFLKGVSTRVTYNKYFNVPRSKRSSKEEIKDLKVALHNGKHELEKKDVELKALSTKVNEQDQTLKLVLAHLNAKGADFPNLSHTIGISSEKIVQSNETSPVIPKPNKKPVQTKSATAAPDAKLISMKSATIANTKTTNKTVESKATTINQNIPKVSPNNPIHQAIKCSISYPYKRNIVARGTIHLSSERQFIHGVPLQDDCYKVSIDEVVVKTAFLPPSNWRIQIS
ncbi:unnamed protein product [Lactuca saligna]|uniref:DUF8039 domain-containing protein n=1 Tax=Lactuca saligna TaxID=75948 RepID=A0AA35VVM7_LACSI|nr:unnamed protein product [Lactuca saligna]